MGVGLVASENGRERAARATNKRRSAKLSDREVRALSRPGYHSDGLGLYVVVDPSGAKRFAFIYRWKARGIPGPGRRREMGLGSINVVSLKEARDLADEARKLVAKGIDPIAAKRERDGLPSFGEMADQVIATKRAEFRSERSVVRLKCALAENGHAHTLRATRVDQVDTAAVLGVLKPIWLEKPETAQKLRGYIETVLSAAKARGYRSGENPATWRGHLDQLLPKRQKLSRGHHAALPHAELPAFMAGLRAREAVSALALEFTVLCASRMGEVLGATWAEFNLDTKVWTVPAERMKAGKVHRVPLSEAALAILRKVMPEPPAATALVFPGPTGERMSDMAFKRLLVRLKYPDITTHGFRSTFSDWGFEVAGFARELVEAALAHALGDETERAYRRGEALEKRRKLMEAWAGFCTGSPAAPNVVQLHSAV